MSRHFHSWTDDTWTRPTNREKVKVYWARYAGDAGDGNLFESSCRWTIVRLGKSKYSLVDDLDEDWTNPDHGIRFTRLAAAKVAYRLTMARTPSEDW